jgi:chemotaxis-related protein WspB
MQLLTFAIGGNAYAIESRRIVEVLPLVMARPLPHQPDFVRGLFSYRGSLVPLVELGLLIGANAAAELLSTRVIIVALGEEARPGLPIRTAARQLGLVAEKVIAIRNAEEATTVMPSLQLASAPYLGRVLRLGVEMVQVLDIDRLLPDDLMAGLFPAATSEGRP